MGVSHNASSEEIKNSYHRLAKLYHPDRNPNNPEVEEYFKSVTEAYNILSDENQRARYDWRLFKQYTNATTESARYRSRTQPRPTYRSRQRYRRPNYAPRYYYTKNTKRMGTLFMIVFTLVVIGVPLSLEMMASQHYFEKGMLFYKQQNYFAALNNFDLAYRDFGLYNYEASLLTSQTLVYRYREYRYALKYITRALNHADSEQELAEVHFLKATCLKKIKNYDKARDHFEASLRYNPRSDSSIFELGALYTFVFNNYKIALQYFDKLDDTENKFQDAYFNRGYCHYQLKKYRTAIHDFDLYLNYSNSDGMPYYFKGLSEMKLNYKISACKDLQKAYDLGIQEAEKPLLRNCEDAGI